MSQLMITGIIDGPLPGGLPKAIQLFALEDIADLSVYGLDATTATGARFTFPDQAVAAGAVVYVSVEAEGFAAYLGLAPDHIVGAIDGDDNGVIELYRDGIVVDVFGDMTASTPGRLLSGNQEVAYRAETAGPSPTFDLSEWIFSGTEAFAGGAASSASAGSEPVFDGPLVINEYRFTAEEFFRFDSNFVELLTTPGARLDGLTLLVINGEVQNSATDNIGQITWAVDLSGAVADKDGYVLVGNDALTTFDAGDVRVAGFDPNGNAQTILVVRNFTGAAGDDLDINDDGTIDNPPYSDVVVGLALRDQDRVRDVLFAADIVQADPLAVGFISAGAARQPDGTGAFVTLPYETAELDTPGFANVASPPEPQFEIHIGTDTADRLVGQDDQRNLLAGKDGDDRLTGGTAADLILDGLGSDRSSGNGGDDILFFQGGGKDHASGGAGADIFKLSADFASNGQRDRLTIHDFDTSEDMLDLTGALLSSVAVNNGALLLRLTGDGDVIVLRGVTDFADVNLTDTVLPLENVPVAELGDFGGDSSENAATGLTLTTLDDGSRLRGSIGDDVFVFYGGDTAVARGNGGADSFILDPGMVGNGVAELVLIRDFGADDTIDFGGASINRIVEANDRVKVFIGPDNDRIVFSNGDLVDNASFIADLPLA